MINNDLLVKAANDYESLTRRQEELGYKHGWVYYKLKEKYGEEIANEVYEKDYCDITSGDGWDGDEGD